MELTPLVLGLLAGALAGPVPALMARSSRLRMTPFAAMALWQAVALAAVLSALGAGLSLATGRTLTGEPSLPGLVVAALALTVTLVVVARLLVSGHRVGTSLRAQRRVHREQIDLVAGRLEDLHILEHDVPVAYCLPGVAKSRVVVSAAALERLERPQLAAVLAHERAHLSARHDLVLEAFTVLHRAFPRWVSSDAALREVQLLVEILADRAAVRVGGAHQLGSALLAMAQGRVPAGSMGAAGSHLVERVRVLADPHPRHAQGVLLVLCSWAVLVLPTALVVAPWLLGLRG
ncbi:M56 family metallopeptidase [Nocardioides campestrisoli]|uniref:M56 family metallopeptidase n=1 Tax=Nocardioides campestrisoli TaxID=2736757 RepID=UPI001CD1A0C8|nr:M56 family metallopeptidase [Nocardioides campestrisoli]